GRHFYLTRKAHSATEAYLFARFHMYRAVYFHKTTRAAEVMLELLFRRFKEVLQSIDTDRRVVSAPPDLAAAFSGQMSFTRYLMLDDHKVTEFLKACAACDDESLKRLGLGLLNRRLFKALEVATPNWSAMRDFEARIHRRLAELGYDGRYSFVADTA